jgi:hypothetical protein
MTKTYTVDFYPCTTSAETIEATSMTAALRACRWRLGRIYRGAEYRTDRPSATDPDEREYVDALDIWTNRADAKNDMLTHPAAVISWA